jgi:hypothetical protein
MRQHNADAMETRAAHVEPQACDTWGGGEDRGLTCNTSVVSASPFAAVALVIF